MLPQKRRPTPPGEILRYEFLEPRGMSQTQLAAALGIARVRVNEILQGRRAVTTDTAVRLAYFFNTTVEFWLGLQMDVDIWDATRKHRSLYQKIRPASAVVPKGEFVSLSPHIGPDKLPDSIKSRDSRSF